MTLKLKLFILLPVSAMLTLAFFMMHNIPGRVVIALLVIFKYYYFFFRIATIPGNKKNLDYGADKRNLDYGADRTELTD